MEIREIKNINVNIRDLDIPPIDVFSDPKVNIPYAPPVTVDIGVPVVDMPGCVEAHEGNQYDNFKINEDDPKGVKTYCDAGIPSFNPIDYNKDELEMTGERPVPQYKGESPKQEAPPPATDAVQAVGKVNTANIECPTKEQLAKEPLGYIFNNGREIVVRYELSPAGQCLRITEDVPIIQQAINGIPPTATVITTGGIAVVATTSALLAKPFADILLKVIKPTVKKVLKKIATIRGKQMKILSVEERRAEQRDRNQAIAKLKSVQAKVKKKG